MNGFAIQILKYLKFYADKMNSVHFPKNCTKNPGFARTFYEKFQFFCFPFRFAGGVLLFGEGKSCKNPPPFAVLADFIPSCPPIFN